jgi:hypothetical protein
VRRLSTVDRCVELRQSLRGNIRQGRRCSSAGAGGSVGPVVASGGVAGAEPRRCTGPLNCEATEGPQFLLCGRPGGSRADCWPLRRAAPQVTYDRGGDGPRPAGEALYGRSSQVGESPEPSRVGVQGRGGAEDSDSGKRTMGSRSSGGAGDGGIGDLGSMGGGEDG